VLPSTMIQHGVRNFRGKTSQVARYWNQSHESHTFGSLAMWVSTRGEGLYAICYWPYIFMSHLSDNKVLAAGNFAA
jgi:hypothetical protein